MFILVAFVRPVVLTSIQLTYFSYLDAQDSVLFRLADATLMPLMKDRTGENVVLFDRERFTMQTVSIVGVFLTFGVVLPPLAIVTAAALYSHTYFSQFIVGHYIVTIPDQIVRNFYAVSLGGECSGVAALLRYSMRVMVPFCLLFYSMFVFDIAGDDLGWRKAIWAPASMLLLPICVYGVYCCCKCWRRSEVKKSVAADAPVDAVDDTRHSGLNRKLLAASYEMRDSV